MAEIQLGENILLIMFIIFGFAFLVNIIGNWLFKHKQSIKN